MVQEQPGPPTLCPPFREAALRADAMGTQGREPERAARGGNLAPAPWPWLPDGGEAGRMPQNGAGPQQRRRQGPFSDGKTTPLLAEPRAGPAGPEGAGNACNAPQRPRQAQGRPLSAPKSDEVLKTGAGNG
jgi:hypothetical protein